MGIEDVVDSRKLKDDRGSGPCRSFDLRPRAVLQLMAEGHGADVSRKTVETHRKNIMLRLELHSIAE